MAAISVAVSELLVARRIRTLDGNIRFKRLKLFTSNILPRNKVHFNEFIVFESRDHTIASLKIKEGFLHTHICVCCSCLIPLLNALSISDLTTATSSCYQWQFIVIPFAVRYVFHGPLARYVRMRVAHAPGMSGTFSPPPLISDPDMHHGTCVTHVPWCMAGSLISGFLWSWWQGKRSRHSRRMRNSQIYVSGKRPMEKYHHVKNSLQDVA